jgi:flagellar biosynthesis protein FliQ
VTPDLPAGLLREGLVLLGIVGGPLFAVLLVVGLVVGVLQAATQVQDPALGFLPRAAAACVVLLVGGSWMADRLAGFLRVAIQRMAGL